MHLKVCGLKACKKKNKENKVILQVEKYKGKWKEKRKEKWLQRNFFFVILKCAKLVSFARSDNTCKLPLQNSYFFTKKSQIHLYKSINMWGVCCICMLSYLRHASLTNEKKSTNHNKWEWIQVWIEKKHIHEFSFKNIK
jgi:hypothetical protein